MSSHFAMFEAADSGEKMAVNTKVVRYVREVKSKTGQLNAMLVFSDDEKGVVVKGEFNEVLAKLGGKEHHKHDQIPMGQSVRDRYCDRSEVI